MSQNCAFILTLGVALPKCRIVIFCEAYVDMSGVHYIISRALTRSSERFNIHSRPTLVEVDVRQGGEVEPGLD